MDILIRIVLVLVLVAAPIAAGILYLMRRRIGPTVDAYDHGQIQDDGRQGESRRWRTVAWLLDVTRARFFSSKR